MLAEDLKELKLQLAKSKCYINSLHQDNAWECMRGNIPNGVLKTASGEIILTDNEPLHGMPVCNVLVGSRDFVKGYLEQKMDKILKGYESMGELLDPGR